MLHCFLPPKTRSLSLPLSLAFFNILHFLHFFSLPLYSPLLLLSLRSLSSLFLYPSHCFPSLFSSFHSTRSHLFPISPLSPLSYVGYEEGGLLTEAVLRKPYTIILLDEFEKAHKSISNLLLQGEERKLGRGGAEREGEEGKERKERKGRKGKEPEKKEMEMRAEERRGRELREGEERE